MNMNIRTKAILCLLALCLVDMLIPIPILGLTLLYIFIKTPPEFPDLMRRIYRAGK